MKDAMKMAMKKAVKDVLKVMEKTMKEAVKINKKAIKKEIEKAIKEAMKKTMKDVKDKHAIRRTLLSGIQHAQDTTESKEERKKTETKQQLLDSLLGRFNNHTSTLHKETASVHLRNGCKSHLSTYLTHRI